MKRVFFAVKIWKVTDPTWFLVQIWKNPIQMKKSGAATIELLQRFYLQKYSNCTYTRIACLSTDMIFAKEILFLRPKDKISLNSRSITYMMETGRPFIKKTIWKSVGCKANTKTLFLSFSCAESIIVSFCYTFGQQRV